MSDSGNDAYQEAHERFSLPPEERAKYIRDNIHLLSKEDLQELVNAVKATHAGDKGAIRRLADRKGRELEELKKQAVKQGVEV